MKFQLKKNPKYKYFVLFITLFCCLGLSAVYGYYVYLVRKTQDKAMLEEIGRRTGQPPDWISIREYVYCDLLKPGTPKGQVEKGLSLIGPYFPPNVGDPIIQIDFKDPATRYNLSPLLIIYDEEWKVVSSGAGEFNHGPRADCEIERAIGRTSSVGPK